MDAALWTTTSARSEGSQSGDDSYIEALPRDERANASLAGIDLRAGALLQTAASLYDLLRDVQANLENKPPNLEGALARIRELLDGERPAA